MNKKIMIIWAMVIVLICASLIFIANSKRDKDLLKLEHDIKISSKKYINDNNIEIKYSEPVLININELIEKEYLNDNNSIEKYCIKRIIVSKKLFYNKYDIEKECEINE